MLALAPSERALASFTVNANLTAGTQSCAAATSLSFTPGVTNTVSYTCSSTQTNNVCTMSGDLNYTLNNSTVTVPCSNLVATGLVVDATFGGVQNGDGTMLGGTPGGVCNAATNVGYVPGTNTFSWTCGAFTASCQPIADTTLDLVNNRVNVQCVAAAPTGVARANPSSLAASAQTLLTVTVSPASNPVSSGITVVADLSSIGGSANQLFSDDGTGGDTTAADGVYSFQATLPLSLLSAPGAKQLPVTIADAQSRASVSNIALSVLTPTWPQGAGLASPGSVSPTSNALLTVLTYPGTFPTSTALGVRADLSSIGGSATQDFYDDGTHGDVQAGDGLFSYTAAVPYPTAGGTKNLPVNVFDAQGRATPSSIGVDVLASTNPNGFAMGQPDNVLAGGVTLLTVRTTPGKHPTSLGVGVAADLSAIGGSSNQVFLDDGLNGDATAGDGIYSYQATIGAGVQPGAVNVPVAVSDSLNRASNTGIPLNITTAGGLAAAGNQPAVTVGKPVFLRVTVTPALAPASTAISVTADLTTFGGSATQVLWDDGNGADQTAGDNIFTMLLDVVPTSVPSGPVRLPAVATDAQGRSATTSIIVNVRGDSLYFDGYEDAQ
jgi:hypothetical protein